MHRWKQGLFTGILFFLSAYSFAQDTSVAGNNDGFMRSEGKIYVVMVIVLTILAGMLIYLVRLDRKMTNLEKGKNN